MFRPAWSGQVCSLGYEIEARLRDELKLDLTDEQAVRLVEYYRLDPATGGHVYRRAALRRPKGAGKSPEGGYIGYAEFCLPVRFSHWSEDGHPVGRQHPNPWIQFAAVSEDQTDNVMVWLFEVLADHPDALQLHNIDLGRSRVYFHDRAGRIEPVTAAAGSREGQPISCAILDQTEAWSKENGGKRLAEVLRRNAGKNPDHGWTLELQNAPAIGDGSVADNTARAVERNTKGVLFDTREPKGAATLDLSDRAAVREALAYAYGESVRWVNLDRLVDEIQDPATDPADARRYYLNVAAPSSDWAFDRERWAALGVREGMPPDGDLIVAGFDGARHDDATALIAVGVESALAWTVGVWERPEGVDDWEVDEVEVTQAVAEMFDRWKVWREYADPPYWESTVAAWQAKFRGAERGKEAVFPWYTNRWRQIGYAVRGLGSAIRSGEISHLVDPDDDVLSRHMGNAARRPVASRDEQGRPLWTLTKPAPGRKIDAAMALVLAWEARTDCIASGFKPRGGGAKFF